MFAPLEDIQIKSIYGGDLPKRMAHCTPDMLNTVRLAAADVKAAGGELILSDMYRSYDMQLQAHLDYVTGKKSAYSPPPGGSMHEAGRAFDLDLSALKMKLSDFWKIATRHGLQPIIDTPSAGANEAWHFDCRGSHGRVYDYYAAGKGDNFARPYTAMAASAIVSTGVKVDALGDDPVPGLIQSGLIRLGQTIGDLDGRMGPKTRAAIQALQLDPNASNADIAAAIEKRLQSAFPDEYFVSAVHALALGAAPPAFSILAAERRPYRPGAANAAVLGKIINMLPDADVIDQAFDLQPAFLGILPDKSLYLDSELQLDTDGWPEGRGKGDKYWQPTTSLKYADNTTSLNANKVPYLVLPLPTSWANDRGIYLGDYAAVIYRGKVTYAVFGDEGPENLIGEGSIQLLRALGQERLKPNGRIENSGAGPGIITIVFPGSGQPAHRKSEDTLLAAIQSEGEKLFTAMVS
jgi:zinc D-Ala-D-Ala carboxypeptidase